MDKTKRFPLRVLLTATTHRLLTEPNSETDNGIGALYKFLEWMTGEPPYTHQLPRFNDECKPYLLLWFPELAKAASDENMKRLDELMDQPGGIDTWLEEVRVSIGAKKEYDVPKIPDGKHVKKDPILEIIQMRKG